MSRGLQGPRAVLNELKWHHDALEQAVVHYIHRVFRIDRGAETVWERSQMGGDGEAGTGTRAERGA